MLINTKKILTQHHVYDLKLIFNTVEKYNYVASVLHYIMTLLTKRVFVIVVQLHF